jgi:hypothetical protein
MITTAYIVADSDTRLRAARRYLALLVDEVERMDQHEAVFIDEMQDKLERWGCSEREVKRLRDLVSTYGGVV